MTYGACCSLSCAQYVKNINVERHTGEYPKVAEVIQKRQYVDDMLVSLETEEEAVRIAKEVEHVHQQGGFDIPNWISNSQAVLRALSEKSTDETYLDLSKEISRKGSGYVVAL